MKIKYGKGEFVSNTYKGCTFLVKGSEYIRFYTLDDDTEFIAIDGPADYYTSSSHSRAIRTRRAFHRYLRKYIIPNIAIIPKGTELELEAGFIGQKSLIITF